MLLKWQTLYVVRMYKQVEIKRNLCYNSNKVRHFYLTVLFLIANVFANAQPIYISAGGGIESGIIDTYLLGRVSDYYSSFKPVFFAGIRGEFGKYYNFKLNYQSDPFWQNSVNAGVGFAMGIIQVGMGVQTGIHDKRAGYGLFDVEYWNIGLDGTIKIELPGYFFVGSDFVLDIGGGNWVAQKPGSAHRQLLSFYAGVWLPHIIISAGYAEKNYDGIVTDAIAVRAGTTRFWGKFEFFAKNLPFRISAESGYLIQTANYSDSSPPLWHDPVETSHIYVGGGFSYEFNRYFRMFLDSQMFFFPFVISGRAGIEVKIFGNR